MLAIRRLFGRAEALPHTQTTIDEEDFLLFNGSEKIKSDIDYAQPPSKYWTKHTKQRKLPSIVKLVIITVALVSAVLSGQSVIKYASLGYNAILQNSKGHGHAPCKQDVSGDEFDISAAAPWGAKALSQQGWESSCSGKVDAEHDCKNAIDGDRDTFWQSNTDPRGNFWIEIDLGAQRDVTSLGMLPRPGRAAPGVVQKHRVEVATEKGRYELVALGTWRVDDSAEKFAIFEPRSVRFVRLTVVDAWKAQFVIIRDINIYTNPTTSSSAATEGKWGLTLDFPLVPVTAFLNPLSYKLITMASYLPWKFDQNKRETFSATWDPKTQIIDQLVIKDAPGHDMFCPGTSFDEKGNVIVTGGDTPAQFSVYDSDKDKWTTSQERLAVPRGYQGQTYLPNGKTFMIGGQWSGNAGERPGEIFDPASGKWRVLANVKSEFIKMKPKEGKDGSPEGMTEWQEHHPWLFAWKEDSVFHAGPSTRMNWIFTNGTDGDIQFGGTRPGNDTVCGVHSMYDAENGAILLAGGSSVYHYYLNRDDCNQWPKNCPNRGIESTNRAFEITLPDKPGTEVKPKEVKGMIHQRIFANGVILPTGETLVVGGMRQGEPFYDDTWQPVPEVYSPETKTWRALAPNSIPRGYHSWAMLLPDATVVVGGAGLRTEATNHYDAQIYHPSYLFNSDGSDAKRPTIKSLDRDPSKQPYKLGETITITTDVDIDTTGSLIRFSAATHALNNDLRRIKLNLKKEGDKKYSVKIPSDPGVTLPGYWMLFVLQKGVPSHATTVQILAK